MALATPLCTEPAEVICSSNRSGKSPTWLLTNCSISEDTEKQNGYEKNIDLTKVSKMSKKALTLIQLNKSKLNRKTPL